MKDVFKLACSNLPFIVGSIVIGSVCKYTKSAMPLWAFLLLPRYNYTTNVVQDSEAGENDENEEKGEE